MSRASTEEATKQPLGTTWYHVAQWRSEPEAFTVIKHTSATVWYKAKDYRGNEEERVRQARIQSEWFKTKREALESIRKRLQRAEEYTRDRYSAAVDALKKFNAKYAGELG